MTLLYIFLIWFGVSLLMISFLILGEFLTIKFPKTKFAKFWREKVIVEDNEPF